MTKSFNYTRIAIVLAALGFSAPALADTVCLRKGPEVQAKGKISVGIVASSNEAAGYMAKGLQTIPCSSENALAQYRDSICDIAKRGSKVLQDQLEAALGEKPAKICASAKLAVTVEARRPPARQNAPVTTAPSQDPAAPAAAQN